MSNRFTVIPVLDLKAGSVVHARGGDRANYRPIRTPLANSSAPAAVLAGLMSLAPFRHLYIADLDAIEGTGNHRAAVAALARTQHDLEIWLDCGLASADAAIAAAGPRIRPVLGTETLEAARVVAETRAGLGDGGCVLSLDYRRDGFVGPAELERDPQSWPDDVIVMSLAHVGSGQGPDLARLARIKQQAGGRRVWAAGGVRSHDDLAQLAAMGIAGALIATALHDGRLTREALAPFV